MTIDYVSILKKWKLQTCSIKICTLNTRERPTFHHFSLSFLGCAMLVCVFKLITCNGSPLCRKWSLNSNPDRFWAKKRGEPLPSLAPPLVTPPSPLPKIHLQTYFSLTWHHHIIILIVCSKDITIRKTTLNWSLKFLFMNNETWGDGTNTKSD